MDATKKRNTALILSIVLFIAGGLYFYSYSRSKDPGLDQVHSEVPPLPKPLPTFDKSEIEAGKEKLKADLRQISNLQKIQKKIKILSPYIAWFFVSALSALFYYFAINPENALMHRYGPLALGSSIYVLGHIYLRRLPPSDAESIRELLVMAPYWFATSKAYKFWRRFDDVPIENLIKVVGIYVSMYAPDTAVKYDLKMIDNANEKIRQGSTPFAANVSSSYLPLQYFEKYQEIEFAGRDKKSPSFRVQADSFSPLKENIYLYGEDCVGASKDGSILLVADGVGGAHKSQLASKVAVYMVIDYMSKHPEADILVVGPALIEWIALFYRMACIEGSTTLTIAQIVGDEVHIVHVGDSYCAIVDPVKKEMVFNTVPREHSHNEPYQITNYENRASYYEPVGYKVHFESGQILLLYSDGVGDNLWPKAISQYSDAAKIAAKTLEVMYSHRPFDIPFNHESFFPPIAAKLDDVSIVLKRLTVKPNDNK